ncbi:WYL domain-containing protein [Haloarcula sp. S1CR25-12]|uniref:WYL domain-containing protein n=2 Tax=Haloarcula saliterrae TaxID=2950534 RepID=A0ABU2FHJ5_9EURY|nr:WYL domain-containing protein [Haloarcula sp. S1CR25-12]
MQYRSSSGTRVRGLDPYGMAMHEGIQYLVGYDYYREEIRIFRPTRIEWVELQPETFIPPADWDTSQYLANEMGFQRTDSDSCFIATAAYGSPTASEIDVLRRFRDDILAKSYLTRWLISMYYALSPPIARWISRSRRRRTAVRRLFVAPLVRLIERVWS